MKSEDHRPQSRLQKARERLNDLSNMTPEELEKEGGLAEKKRAAKEFNAAELESRSDPNYPLG